MCEIASGSYVAQASVLEGLAQKCLELLGSPQSPQLPLVVSIFASPHKLKLTGLGPAHSCFVPRIVVDDLLFNFPELFLAVCKVTSSTLPMLAGVLLAHGCLVYDHRSS